MVTSIVLTGMHNIGISASKKIKTPDGVTVDVKDIPFVRYRFSKYGEEELAFIKRNKEKFPCVHVAEVDLDLVPMDVLGKLDDLDENIAKMVYVAVRDEEVLNGFSTETLEALRELPNYYFDSLSIKDKSDTLFPLALTRLRKQIKEVTGIKEADIGVCGGPCCFIDGNACLTAVKARSLLAEYSLSDDVVVPSANHEGKLDDIDNNVVCTNKCGCIRYHIFDKDVAAPVSKSGGASAKQKVTVSIDGQEVVVEGAAQAKKQKASKPKGYTAVEW